MDFVRLLFKALLPGEIPLNTYAGIINACQRHLDYAITDSYFVSWKPSIVGAACLASCLDKILPSARRESFWFQLAGIFEILDIMTVQNKLLGRRQSTGFAKIMQAIDQCKAPKKKKVHFAAVLVTTTDTASGNSAPICITQSARQA